MEPVLIATDSSHTDVCAIQNFTLDMAIGYDRQDFTACFKPITDVGGGSLLYIDGTEYGGIVDDVTTDTETSVIQCHGRTWDGILACKRIMPPDDSTYRRVSGEANSVLSSLITLLDLGDVFTASTDASGITISNYDFARFVDGYEGITKMLASANAKLVIRKGEGKAVLSAEPASEIEDEADSDLMDFTLTKTSKCVNHLVCAGEGEGTEREVIHLYADASGNVSQTQTLFGVDEITAFYDYSNAESEELMSEGIEKLKEYQTQGEVDITRIGKGDWDIGDTLVVRDNKSGLVVSTPVAGKTVKVNSQTNWLLSVEYEIGQVSRTTPSASGQAEQVEKVNRAGDTMTGALSVDENLYLNTWIDSRMGSAFPDSIEYDATFGRKDPSGNYCTYNEIARQANGNLYQSFAIRRYDQNDENPVTNGFYMHINDNGTKAMSFTDPSAWCSGLHVGDIVTSEVSSSVSVATSTYKSLTSITMAAGVWVVTYGIGFSHNATGTRAVMLYTSQNTAPSATYNRNSLVQCPAVTTSSNGTYLRGASIYSSSSQFTEYLTAWQNSGSAINCTGWIRGVRIK